MSLFPGQDVRNTCIGWLVYEKRQLLTVDQSVTVENALQLMAFHNVVALPVESGSSESTKHFVGILTTFDLLTFVAFGCFKYNHAPPSEVELLQSLQTAVGDVVRARLHEEDRRVWAFPPSTPLPKVLELMSKGVHRVLVEIPGPDSAHPLEYRMLTQSDVVRYLYSHCDTLRTEMLACSLDALKLIRNDVVSLPSSASALDGFRMMQQRDVSAVPVVDHESGAVMTALTASDLRGVTAVTLARVRLPVLEFLRLVRGVQSSACLHPTFRRAIVVSADTLLRDAITTLLIAKVHRVFIVDAESKPVGILSLSDIITKYSPYDCTSSPN